MRSSHTPTRWSGGYRTLVRFIVVASSGSVFWRTPSGDSLELGDGDSCFWGCWNLSMPKLSAANGSWRIKQFCSKSFYIWRQKTRHIDGVLQLRQLGTTGQRCCKWELQGKYYLRRLLLWLKECFHHIANTVWKDQDKLKYAKKTTLLLLYISTTFVICSKTVVHRWQMVKVHPRENFARQGAAHASP